MTLKELGIFVVEADKINLNQENIYNDLIKEGMKLKEYCK